MVLKYIFHKIPNLTAKYFKLLIFLITETYLDTLPIENIKSFCLFCNICFLWKIFYAGGLLKDKVIVDAAVGDIKIGSGEEELITKTAEEDGVIEIDATSAYNYSILKKIKTNFENSYITDGITIVQTPNEEALLLSDEKLISKDYESSLGNSFSNGSISRSLGCQFISSFAGSDNGTGGRGVIADPILPEIGGSRTCLALGNGAIQMGMVDIEIDFNEKLQEYVNSSGLNVFVRAYAVRLEGCKVQKIKTTI